MAIILRPVYNRPEMLALSLEFMDKALGDRDIKVLFVVEAGADAKCIELAKREEAIYRDQRVSISHNVLNGMHEAFQQTDDFIYYIEDDTLVHHSYFQYMDVLQRDAKDWCVLSPFTKLEGQAPGRCYYGNHYSALAPLISKQFYVDFILPLQDAYLKNPIRILNNLNEKYKDNPEYKYKDITHNEQAGLINRLIDVARIEQGLKIVQPELNRQQHIGYYGANRGDGALPGNSFEERLENLRKIRLDPARMYLFSPAKAFKDYTVFHPNLENWDGEISIEDTIRSI